MLRRHSSRPRNFFKKVVIKGVDDPKTALQNECLLRLYDADAELKAISQELDSFDGKKDPVRCNLLVNQLRTAQDKVISLLFQLMDDCNCKRASRDYRMKFPDEILLSEGSESLNGQIWFGAECLSAGSNILNHAKESSMLRPMAKSLTSHLDALRSELRELVLDGRGASYIDQALINRMAAFDHIFAMFEYEYVKTMLPIRTVAEIEKLQEVAVLFSETLIDIVKRGLVKQVDIDEFQPLVMIAIPRLAIVRGLLYRNENPIYTRHKSHMCSLFQPFHGPLHSIRRLLRNLTPEELLSLERMLANDHQSGSDSNSLSSSHSDSANPESQAANSESRTCELSTDPQLQASTSNGNYANVLKDGLQYPVGQKRFTEEAPSDDCESSTVFTDKPSSSKNIITNPTTSQDSPDVQSGSASCSPSSSSSSPSPRPKAASVCGSCTNKQTDDTAANEDGQVAQGADYNCDKTPPNTTEIAVEPVVSDPSQGPSQLTKVKLAPEVEAPADSETSPIKATCSKSRDAESAHNHLIQQQTQQLLQRLFVAISGVADQLQSNFASDLRFILRHIFASEDDDDAKTNKTNYLDNNGQDYDDFDEEDYEDDDDYSNDHSDSSLPIEQGIEAQEVANLIDFEGNYSQHYADYDDGERGPHYPPGVTPGSSGLAFLSTPTESNDDSTTAVNSSTMTGTAGLYASSVHAGTARVPHQRGSGGAEMLASMMDAAVGLNNETVLPGAQPTLHQLMDDYRQRQRFVHQHFEALSRAISSDSPSSSSNRPWRHANSVSASTVPVYTGSAQGSLDGSQASERRSRHHHHHHHRSRRSRGPPVWVPDQLVVACSSCSAQFTLFRRRHHCRACGQIFCGECSRFTKNLNRWGYSGPVRVCESCYSQP